MTMTTWKLRNRHQDCGLPGTEARQRKRAVDTDIWIAVYRSNEFLVSLLLDHHLA